ncbi:MFS general substrate transporter [Gonapodya prolifera JEL478]|uniref:MFS general substrate transporter n=1 Tax=Gonapodya prolifera (strain JEL478) TaxID=1344416 RepID=A0A139AIL7_GONPJ|nr:MFS general substrate transporter [Gonapodya prolifera JEL478]|eukprot:KXS16588.1 MFS general substrate transporter [Gonapodya prolifera JEL478]
MSENAEEKMALDVEGDATWTPEEEKAVVRKLDLFIVPFISLLYLCNYLDRGNLANAKVANSDKAHAGMLADLGMTQLDYNFVLGIFFVGYSIGEIPSNFFLKSWGANRWFARICITWGICAACMAAIQTYGQALAVRFLLGVAEAGFFPGAGFYFVLFYRPFERSRRLSWMFTTSALAGAFSGLFATAISNLDGTGGLAGWRWIFLLEGIPSIIVGIITMFYLPSYPSKCWFLTERQKYIAAERLPKEDVKEKSKAFVLSDWLEMFRDPKVWMFMIVYLIHVNGNYANSAYLPTVISNLGWKANQAQLLTAPIYLTQFVFIPIMGYLADKTKKPWAVITGAIVVAVVGFLINAISLNNAVRYFGLFLNNIGIGTTAPILLAWIGHSMLGRGSTITAGAMSFMSGAGHLGGISGPQMFQADDSPKYTRAWSILAASYCLNILTVVALEWMHKGRNNALAEDAEYEKTHTEHSSAAPQNQV